MAIVGRVAASIGAGMLASGLGVWATLTVLAPHAGTAPAPVVRTVVAPVPGPSPECAPWPECGLERLRELQQIAYQGMCLRAQLNGVTDACPPPPRPAPTRAS